VYERHFGEREGERSAVFSPATVRWWTSSSTPSRTASSSRTCTAFSSSTGNRAAASRPSTSGCTTRPGGCSQMTLRRRGALSTRKARTQGAVVAALRTRQRTKHGAAQGGPVAEGFVCRQPQTHAWDAEGVREQWRK
jgi:hypothetical protein